MDHISENKIRIESIKVPIDRSHPDAQYVKFPHIAIHFYGRGWPSKLESTQSGALKCPDR
jgi:hypothetical protein